jgi:translation initiation factor 1
VARSPEPGPEPASLTGDPPLDLAACGKLVLRRERKGRGGRTVTVIAGLLLPAPGLAEVARRLRRALGCGASVEGDTIVLQGDLGERAAEWLTARGARRVVRG